MSERMWESGEPTMYGLEVYTAGDCWALAYYLHRQGGWPIVTVAPKAEPDWWEHVLVQLPDRTFLDVEGVHTRSGLLKRWGYGDQYGIYALGPTLFKSWRAYTTFIGDPDMMYLGVQRHARVMAKRLIEKYEL